MDLELSRFCGAFWFQFDMGGFVLYVLGCAQIVSMRSLAVMCFVFAHLVFFGVFRVWCVFERVYVDTSDDLQLTLVDEKWQCFT